MARKFDLVCFGELLWDNLPSGSVLGGAPFNIVNRACALGLDAVVISSVGKDDKGERILSEVRNRNLTTDFVQIHDDLPTSEVNIHVGEGGEPHYDIVYPVAWDDITRTEEIKECIQMSRSFVYSSLGLRDRRSREVLFQLLEYADLKICDINLREGHFDQETIQRMMQEADILKANEHEIALVSTWHNLENLSILDQIKALQQKYQYECVIATLGGEGAICYNKGSWTRQPVFPVKVKDTVGSGDAFLASFIFKYLQDHSIAECLQFACAVGALTASKDGGTPSITQSEINQILQS